MKLAKRPHRKPTWASENSAKVHAQWGLKPKAVKERILRNNKIARILKKHGWVFTEGVGIAEVGGDYYSLNFRKSVPGVAVASPTVERPNRHPWVHFSFRWDNQGGADFAVGEMFSFYNYSPQAYHMRPHATFEIRDITEDHLHLLDDMFNGVVAAINSQNPSYGSSNHVN